MPHIIRYQQARRITLIGVAVNIILSVAKIVFGIIGKSHALVADGIHSTSDLLTDVLVLFAAKYGSRAADLDHPYGHQRIETAATVLLALILSAAGIFIIVDAIMYLLSKQATTPHPFVLWIALVSIISKEILYRSTLKIAEQIKSNLLRANAWHHRSDAASSLVVFVGIGGALLGYHYLDSIAAVIVGAMIIKMGAELGWTGVRELVDTGMDETTVEKIHQIIIQTSGVKALHQLRTRMMGHQILVDVHIQVEPYLSVSEGHFIGQKVHESLMKEIDAIHDVTVHIDPEEDEQASLNLILPERDIFLSMVRKQVQHLPGSSAISNITLHYLSGKIDVEICIPLQYAHNAEPIVQIYCAELSGINHIRSVKINFT